MSCTYKEKFHFTNSVFEISTNTFMTKVYLLVAPTHHTQLSIVLSNHLAPTHFENNLMKLKLNNSQKVNVSPTIDLARLCTGMEDRNENGKRPQKIQFHFLGESSSSGNEVISAFNFNTTHPPVICSFTCNFFWNWTDISQNLCFILWGRAAVGRVLRSFFF